MNPHVMSENSMLEQSRILTIFSQPITNIVAVKSNDHVYGIELVSVEIKKAVLEAENKKAEALNMLHLQKILR